jgi:hypothetical protein
MDSMNMRASLLCICILIAASPGKAAVIEEDFSANPATGGWNVFGDTNLFQWDITNQNLRVTWDSSRTNSYYYHPLPTILAKDDDFSIAFDLRLDEVATGVNPARPSTFQIAVALLNLNDATRSNFFRGTGINAVQGPRSSVEFDYFPDSSSGFGATIAPTLISSNNQFAYNDTFPLEITVGDLFRIEMNYTASNRTLATIMTRNGDPFGPVDSNIVGASFTDFRLDTFAICSFSDEGQNPPEFAGSILARGVMDNIFVTTPPAPIGGITGMFINQTWQVQFLSGSNWLYTLERTADFQSWTNVSLPTDGAAGTISLSDTNAPVENAFYRIRAERP